MTTINKGKDTTANPAAADRSDGSNLQKDPDSWKTGDEPMTGAQRSYLETLASETNEAVDDTLTKAEASKRIDELRQRSPRVSGDA